MQREEEVEDNGEVAYEREEGIRNNDGTSPNRIDEPALAEERVHSTDEPGLHHRKAQDLEGNVLLPFASFQLVVR